MQPLTRHTAVSRQHPTLRCLPASVKLHSFDEVYESSATLQDVYPQARRSAALAHARGSRPPPRLPPDHRAPAVSC